MYEQCRTFVPADQGYGPYTGVNLRYLPQELDAAGALVNLGRLAAYRADWGSFRVSLHPDTSMVTTVAAVSSFTVGCGKVQLAVSTLAEASRGMREPGSWYRRYPAGSVI